MDHFDSSSSDNDMFFNMMYDHYLDELKYDVTLQTRTTKLNRNRAAAHERLYRDYFADESVYDAKDFKRRSRFFQLKYDARGRRGFTALQKCTAALRVMAYGASPDSLDEYLRMSRRTVRKSMHRFTCDIVELFGPIYLRKPTVTDVQQLFVVHEERHGFLGTLGNIDCTHWDSKNCPQSWRWEYTGDHHRVPSLVLEVVAFQDLWI